jgi:hypothetical protein
MSSSHQILTDHDVEHLMKSVILAALTTSALSFALAGCSTVPKGASEAIASEAILINTNPEGANCTLERQGELLTSITGTPSFVTVKKSKYHITILCNKTGFQEASFIVLGGGARSTIDSVSEADYEYDAVANITLIPVSTSMQVGTPAHASESSPQPIAVDPPTP